MAAGSEEIAQHFRRLIAERELRPGDRLPTIRMIAETWGVARATAERAIMLLRHAGLVTTHGRHGTLVASPGSISWPSRDLRIKLEMMEARGNALLQVVQDWVDANVYADESGRVVKADALSSFLASLATLDFTEGPDK